MKTMFTKILCPTDFSEASYQALKVAIGLASICDAEVCLMHVEPDLREILTSGGMSPHVAAQERAEAVRDLCILVEERTPPQARINTLLRDGDPAEEILRVAYEHNSDLIVLSHRGEGESTEKLGSVAAAVLLHAPCPVLMVNVNPAQQNEPLLVHSHSSSFGKDGAL